MRVPARWIISIFFCLLVALLVVPLFRPKLAIYVTVVAIGSAVALQKYISSFAGYFVLRTSKLFEVGHRVRIGSNVKGDVRQVGLLHFVLDEVGEGDKSGGELTGRVIHIPNHMILDQPVVNYSQDYSTKGWLIHCDYVFDEVRLPLPDKIPLSKAREILSHLLQQEDAVIIQQAKEHFGQGSPNFLDEAVRSPRVMVFVDGSKTWLVGRFVAPVRGRNQLRSVITTCFLEAMDREKAAMPVEITH